MSNTSQQQQQQQHQHHPHDRLDSSDMYLDKLPSVGDWQREHTLGSGSFASITLWINKNTDQQIALKQNRTNFYGSNQKYDEKWRQEIKIMRQINHNNVVATMELPVEFQSLKLKTPILAMEYCSGGDLRQLLNKPENCCGLSEKEVRQILKQISSAIVYLHDLKIIHRDLKPENIVLQPLTHKRIRYKLIDLGYAKQLLESTSTNSFVGTLEYLAPELFLGIKHTSAVDNWSFGLLAFEIITGRRPFLPNHSMADVLDALKKKKSADICTMVDSKGNYYFSREITIINQISSSLKSDLDSWLRIVLEYDPAKRGGRGAFQMVHEIMNKYKVQIYAIDLYDTFPFEINMDTELEDLKERIFSSTNTLPANQYLFFQNGDVPEAKVGRQIIQTWYTPDSWFERYNPILIFMFDHAKGLHYEEVYKYLSLPPSVESILLDQENIDHKSSEKLKLTWRYSILVVQQIVKIYTLVNETLKSCILNCMHMFNRLQSHNQTLYNTLTEVFSSVNVIERLIKSDTRSKYDSADTRSMKNGCLTSEGSGSAAVDYLEIYRKLKPLYQLRRDEIGEHLAKSQRIVPKFDKQTFMFDDFFKSAKINPPLMNKYTEILNAFDSMRKRKKDELIIQSSYNLMIKLLCDCFKLVETLFPKIFSILETLGEFLQNITAQMIRCEQLQWEIDKWKIITLEDILETLVRSKKKSYHSDMDPSNVEANKRSTSTLKPSSPSSPSTNDEMARLVLELEEEESLWKRNVFDFDKLEFCNFLF